MSSFSKKLSECPTALWSECPTALSSLSLKSHQWIKKRPDVHLTVPHLRLSRVLAQIDDLDRLDWLKLQGLEKGPGRLKSRRYLSDLGGQRRKPLPRSYEDHAQQREALRHVQSVYLIIKNKAGSP